MKLYKEASLMMLPTSVKDGKLYSIFPQPKPLSGELVTNGDFSDGLNGWVEHLGNPVVSNGVVHFTGDLIKQSILTIGKTYKVTVNVTEVNSGLGKIQLGSTIVTFSGLVEEQTFYVTATDNADFYVGRNSSTDDFKIDNVSVKEVDQVPADFDFSRGSNLAATRINEQGLIEKGRENLLLHSNQFDTTWTTDNVANPTSGVSGYDGTSDGWLLNINGGTVSQHIKQSVSGSGVQTFSVYAKANALDWMLLYVATSTLTRAYFDIANGSLGSTNNLIESKITSAGSGWYRCSITFNASITDVRIYLANANGSLTQSSGSIYIQDAQLEAGLVATDYIESGATTGKAGVLEDLPRLNWGECPSLLLEPQRINNVKYSEYREGSDADDYRVNITSNAEISPDGLQNATLITEDTNTNTHFHSIGGLNWVAGNTYTLSVFVKSNGRDFSIRAGNNAVINFDTVYDLTNNVVLSSSASLSSIEDFGNGWYRVTATATALQSLGTNYLSYLYNNGLNYQGDGSSGVYVYGFQVEQGSYATSYIPTRGQAATRAADVCTNAGDSTIFNDEEGVLYAEVSKDTTAIDGGVSISDGTYSNRVLFYFDISGNIRAYVYSSGEQAKIITNGLDYTQNNKLAIKYSATSTKFFVNGSLVGTEDTSSTMPVGLNQMNFHDGGGGSKFYGKCKVVTYFNRALSDNECINLTTI